MSDSPRSFSSVVNCLQERCERAFKGLTRPPQFARFTVSMAGFLQGEPFVACLSNCEDEEGSTLEMPDGKFHVWYRHPVRRDGAPVFGLVAHGQESVAERVFTRDVVRALKKRYAGRAPSRTADLLVQCVRRGSDDVHGGRFIGRNCLSTIVTPRGDFVCRDHRDQEEPVQSAPHYVCIGGAALYGFEVSSVRPEWWSGP